ncbi:MAG: HEAT repeat domain-containing protein [Deltaproteobacteria bacterium]|nr:HEAT repeat domain-containing protein [Deltaproteobacteria bacterium]
MSDKRPLEPPPPLEAGGAGDTEEETRRRSVLKLGEEMTASLDDLVSALGDRSWRVRKAALDVILRRHPMKGLVPRLIRALASEDNAGLRNASAEALTRIGHDAVSDLILAIDNKDVDLQKFAIDVLGEIGDRVAVPALVRVLEDSDENVRAAAAEALGKIGSLDAIDALWKKALGTADLLSKLSALEALVRLEAPGPFEQLSELTKNRFCAKAAYGLLAVCPDPRAIETLVRAITDNPRSQKTAAVLALHKRIQAAGAGEQDLVFDALNAVKSSAIVALGELLHASEVEVVGAAMRVLGATREPQVVRPILDAVTDDALWPIATEALASLGPEAMPHVAEAFLHVSNEARELVASMLAERGDARAIRMLVAGMLDGERKTRDMAARALARVPNQVVIAEVLEALERADEEALGLFEEVLIECVVTKRAEAKDLLMRRIGAADLGARQVAVVWRALSTLVGEDDLALLLSAMKDERDAVRAAAAEGLSVLQSAEARRALLLCLSDESPLVRKAVAAHLQRFSGDAVRDALIVATRDEDGEVAAAATQGLSRFGDDKTKEALSALVQGDRAPVVIAAISALHAVAPEDLSGWLGFLLSHKDVEVIKEAVRVILAKNEALAAQFAERLLSHPQWDVRYVAVTTLGNFRSMLAMLQARQSTETDALVKQALDEALSDGAPIGEKGTAR